MLIREIHLRGEDAFQRILRPTERAGEFHEARTQDICSLSLYTTNNEDNDDFSGVISSLCPISVR